MIGYTTGVFDMFHIGHLRLLKEASKMCDFLIVGVITDDLAKAKKGSLPRDPFPHRLEIVSSLDCVDVAIVETNLDKVFAHEKLKYDILFVGDDHYGEERWRGYEEKLPCKVIYLPYTKGVSSTERRKLL